MDGFRGVMSDEEDEAWSYDVQALWCLVQTSVPDDIWEVVEENIEGWSWDGQYVAALRSALYHHAPEALPEFDELVQTAGA